ncbi:protein kinase [Actinocorallia sp. API 0066]|uniref:serine/threonine-protein kinase n=1 Tax=Actinocorallia sp. API 0066 TaxID=2896846 RepID=UPI001E4BA2EA|nr:serine/threonine-protein kinase [Actinocorallia sp. API 0066]MCD0448337.1 protein kinase [Actinocorallia sp. API 0066]
MDQGTLVADRYRLADVIGRGGMGVVWRATDERLRREVALKQLVLPPGLDDAARARLVARVEREALAAAVLRHPGIVTVHDLVTDADGIPWIVMELVHGRSLADLVAAEGPLAPERAAEIGAAVLAALGAAHAGGVVHRDIKPANILLEDGRVVLTDFGIAAVEGEGQLTQTGSVLGTPHFMSPEQVAAAPVTPASDLWSLGATLYHAVEGRPPFSAPTASAVFLAIAHGTPTPPTNAGPLAPALTALLSKNPEDRPNAAEAAALLKLTASPPPPEPAIAGTAVDAASSEALLSGASGGVPETTAEAASPGGASDVVPADAASSGDVLSRASVGGARVPPPGPEPVTGVRYAPPTVIDDGGTRVPPPRRRGYGRHVRAAAATLAFVAGFALFSALRDDDPSGAGGAKPTTPGTEQAAAPVSVPPTSVPDRFSGTWRNDQTNGDRIRLEIDEGDVGERVGDLRTEVGGVDCEAVADLVRAAPYEIEVRVSVTEGTPSGICADGVRLTLTSVTLDIVNYTAGEASGSFVSD